MRCAKCNSQDLIKNQSLIVDRKPLWSCKDCNLAMAPMRSMRFYVFVIVLSGFMCLGCAILLLLFLIEQQNPGTFPGFGSTGRNQDDPPLAMFGDIAFFVALPCLIWAVRCVRQPKPIRES